MLQLLKILYQAILYEPPSRWMKNGYYKILDLFGIGISTKRWYDLSIADQITNYVQSSKHKEIENSQDLLYSTIIPTINAQKEYLKINAIKVSVIIPFRDEIEMLITCLESILLNTCVSNYEIVLVNNQSKPTSIEKLQKYCTDKTQISLLHYNQPFNYAGLHNWVINKLDTDFCLLLNNDTTILTKNWIKKMLLNINEDVAIVGTRLLYPDGTIQHDGVWFAKDHSNNVVVTHLNKNQLPNENNLFMGDQIRFCSATTAACLLISKKNYLSVGGMDDENLKINFNDVDLCFKIRAKGKKIVVDPSILLTHFESKTRDKNLNREQKEFKHLYKKWKKQLNAGDPFVPKYWTIFQSKMSLRKL